MPLLTRREEDKVVRLAAADGLTNRDISQKLNVAEHSIRNYFYRICTKLGVSTRSELVVYAIGQRDRTKSNLGPRKAASPSDANVKGMRA